MDKNQPLSMQYCTDVLSGKQVAGKYVRLACQRHLDDLKNGHERGLYFDEKAAQKVLDFFHLLRHHKGEWAGQLIVLEPWQQFYLWCLYGWKRKDGTRRFRSSYLAVARKNGKTTLSAGKALYALILDGEPGAQVYTVATKEQQARICFNDVGFIVDKTPPLKKVLQSYQSSIVYQGNSFVQPLGSDSKRQDGFDPSYGVVDEYHAHEDASMLDVLESGMGARRQPMIDIITTAGYNQQGPCYKLELVIKQILEGKLVDDAQFGMVFCLDEEDLVDPKKGEAPAWHNPDIWVKANPNLGISPKLSFMLDRLTKAKNEGGEKEVDFKTKNLNIWTQAAKTWIQDSFWLKGTKQVVSDDFQGMYCFGGLDLSSKVDITAFSLLFPQENGIITRFGWYFVPEDSIAIRSRRDKVNYRIWADQGYIFETPGNVIDYDFVLNKILELGTLFRIQVIGFDPWNSSYIVPKLYEAGVNLSEIRQGFQSLSAPTKEYQTLLLGGKLLHANDPVHRWALGNVAILKDSNGNIRPDKEKSQEKIDPVVADILALREYLIDPNQGGSVYDNRGILTA